VRVVGDLNAHGVKQHLIETIREQRLGQLAEEILQYACTHADRSPSSHIRDSLRLQLGPYKCYGAVG